ncbi:MAG: sulfite exporter TauE/SafE family protein [Saprospiraceae bacterium]|nr:sulfite exporter TauE/SafE family protein [Saprospiraceae bacterium]
MSILVLSLAILIGISLGLIGGGGSILTVPVLVYVAGVSPTLSTAYSLFIVGSTSLVGGFNNMTKKLVHIPTAIIFSIPSFIAVYSVRKFVIPLIPETIFHIGNLAITKNIFIMIFFAAIMLFASLSMIRDKKQEEDNSDIANITFNYPLIILEGFVVGALTGFVGAGGGFLIIPALVMFAKLPMRLAIGTSLVIIAIKSLIGFTGDVQNLSNQIDWILLMTFTGAAIVGIFIGSFLAKSIKANSLKKGFGWFVLIMAIYILSKELLFPSQTNGH